MNSSDPAKQKERDLEGMEGSVSPVLCLRTAKGKGSERENDTKIFRRWEVIRILLLTETEDPSTVSDVAANIWPISV